MTYSDLHRADGVPASADSSHGRPTPAGRTDVLRIVLWLVLGLSATGNLVWSIIGAGAGPHLLFGALSAVSGVTLGVRFLRARR
ncbi:MULTISPECIES: hypothetical protein [Streptomyces]|uniref:hypothetical protein n=1 Tax=Streptomyces TaxID=1883 RepID=UPI00136BB124|nr:hypothetical protein [Streptomyces sp. SID2888]MYV45576.1 hypothetical protein [Streptomyces sp. SID2888]